MYLNLLILTVAYVGVTVGFSLSSGARAPPAYQRGPEPNWMTPKRYRDNGLTYVGAHERLRIVFDRLMRGEHTVITAVGASITAGSGSMDGFPWPTYFHNWLMDAFPSSNITFVNGAVVATMSDYMAVCSSSHIPNNTDLVILEYAVNDIPRTVHGMSLMDNSERRAMERLLRRLLEYPHRPAVVFLNIFSWFVATSGELRGVFYHHAEADFAEFSWYYSIPSVSVKAAVYPLMERNASGFRVDKCCRHTPEDRLNLVGQTFYGDGLHPAGDTGARATSELLIHLFMKVTDGLKTRPLGEDEKKAAVEPLPRPMIAGNYPSASDRCFLGLVLVNSVLQPHVGWIWMDERRHGAAQPKLGFVSSQPESTIRFKLDTRASVGQDKNATVEIGIAHLRSYEHMGKGLLNCLGGCQCSGDMVLEGLDTTRKVSQLHIHSNIRATQSSECILQVTVSDQTNGTGHKVKIVGIFVAEEVDSGGRIAAALSRGALDSLPSLKISPNE
jgi:lysophospholipase L1-like esterase